MTAQTLRTAAFILTAVLLPVPAAIAEDAGPTGVDAGSASVVDAGPAQPSTEPAGSVDARVRRLRLALGRAEALDVPLASLFVIDVPGDTQVHARAAHLERRALQLAAASTSTVASAELQRMEDQLEAAELERRFLLQDRAARAARLSADQARRVLRAELEQARETLADAVEDERRAEAEHARALEEAAAASSNAVWALKSETAALAKARAELAELEQRRSTAIDGQTQDDASALANAERLVRLQQHTRTASAARRIHGQLAGAIDEACADLFVAIDVLDQPLSIPRSVAGPSRRGAPRSEAERAATAELLAAQVALETQAAEVLQRDQRVKLAALDSTYRRFVLLTDALHRAFADLPAPQREALLGFGSEALDLMRIEATVLRLASVARLHLGLEQLRHIKDAATNGTALKAALWIFTKILLVVIIALGARSRVPDMLRALRRYELRSAGSIVGLRRLEQLGRVLGTFGGPVGQLRRVDDARAAGLLHRRRSGSAAGQADRLRRADQQLLRLCKPAVGCAGEPGSPRLVGGGAPSVEGLRARDPLREGVRVGRRRAGAGDLRCRGDPGTGSGDALELTGGVGYPWRRRHSALPLVVLFMNGRPGLTLRTIGPQIGIDAAPPHRESR